MYRKLLAGALGLVALSVTTAAQAQDNWVLLGERNVNIKADKDTIDVTAAKGQFKAVRLVADRRPIDISKIQVVYSGGGVHNEVRNINLKPGERTRAIDPRDSGRFIDQINMDYKTEPGNLIPGKVLVYGLQDRAGARAARTIGSATAAASTTLPGSATVPAATSLRPGQATSGGDVLFGSHTVGFGIDKDIIKVGADVGKFDRIRFRVLDNDIHIKSIKVNFADGGSEDLAYNKDVRGNTRTDWFQLKGDKFIRSIDLLYKSRAGFGGKAFIEVYGQYAEGWLGPQGEGRKFNAGWVLLGGQTANFILDKSDVIAVGRNEGGFRAIQVRVRDEAITLRDVKITYGNGEVDTIPVPAELRKVEAGGTYGPIVLKGGTRVIQDIKPTYRTRYFQKAGLAKGRATVEFWGQH